MPFQSEGTNPDGKAYAGTATITKLEHTWSLQWMSEDELMAVGIGIRKDDVLAVVFQTKNGTIGLSLYTIRRGKLEGTWTVPGADLVANETLTKTKPPKPQPALSQPGVRL